MGNGVFLGQNKRADMLSDGKWGVNGVCVTWRDLGAKGPEQVGEQSEARVGDLRTREKMKRVEFGQHARALCILFVHWQSYIIGGG